MFSNTWYIIVNPCSGSGKTISEWELAKRKLEEDKVGFEFVRTEASGHAEELAYSAARSGWRKFVAAGGDGTVHEMFSGIMKYVESEGVRDGVQSSDFTIAAIPIGSGNDWIKTTAVPHDAVQAAGLIASETISTQDVVKVSYGVEKVSYMVNIGGVGFDANVCIRVNDRKAMGKRSRLIYAGALLHTLRNYKATDVEICCDDELVYSGPCYSVAFANGIYSGGGFRQTSPVTSLNDGILDMTIIPDVSLLQIIIKLPALVNGTLYSTSPMKSFRGKKFTVKPLTALCASFEIDGEVLGRIPLELELLDKTINIVTGPQNTNL